MSAAGSSRRGPLHGLRVVQIDDTHVQYGGKLLADLGADIVLVEPPGGHPARSVPPFVADRRGARHSLYFAHYHLNTRSAELDLRTDAGRAAAHTLARSADVVLDGRAPGSDVAELDVEALMAERPRLIVARTTPFGRTGPWSGYASSDLVQLALGGTMTMTGYDDEPGAASVPIAPAGGQADHLSGIFTAIAVLAALHHRELTGRGQSIDVATHDVVARSNEMGIPYWVFRHEEVRRHTGRHGNPKDTARQLFRSRDGRWVMCLTTYMNDDRRFSALVDWLAGYGLAEDLGGPGYTDAEHRQRTAAHVVEVIERFCAQLDADELFHGAQRRKIPWAPVNSPWDLTRDANLRDRGAVLDVDIADLGMTIPVPGAPYRFEKTPWSIRTGVPRVGQHTAEVLAAAPHGRRVPGDGGDLS